MGAQLHVMEYIHRWCNATIDWQHVAEFTELQHREALAEADVYVSPELSGGFAHQVAEALLLGKSVIATVTASDHPHLMTSVDDFFDEDVGYPIDGEAKLCQSLPCTANASKVCIFPPCNGRHCSCAKLKRQAQWLKVN